MMAVLEDIFPLDLCTPSTCHSADTSACISTTSWMQQSGVYRRQKSSRLIVVSGELVALSSLAQHRSLSLRHAIASPSTGPRAAAAALAPPCTPARVAQLGALNFLSGLLPIQYSTQYAS